MIRTIGAALAIATALAGAPNPATAASETLRAALGMSKHLIYAKNFLKFVEEVNKKGKGVVKIEVIDGGESPTPYDRVAAVRDGRIDMAFGLGGPYFDLVPEAFALVGSDIKTMELRASRAMPPLDHIHRTRMNVRFLGLLNSGIRVHLYMKVAPRLVDGYLRLSDMRIAGAPVYRNFVEALNAELVETGVADAAEPNDANMPDGVILPRIGVAGPWVRKGYRYRIDPGFSRVLTATVVNLPKWNRLDAKARALLSGLMIEHETKSYFALRVLRSGEDEFLEQRGLRVVTLKGQGRGLYVGEFTRNTWDRLKSHETPFYSQLKRSLRQQ